MGGPARAERCDEAQRASAKLPAKIVRTAYRNITKFLESNTFLAQARMLKLKQTAYLDRELFEGIEACRLHWQKNFRNKDFLTREEQIKNFAIEFAFNTTSIEGNTITFEEAAKLLAEQITPKNRTLREVYDIQNTERVFLSLTKKTVEINQESIIALHSELMKEIDVRIGYRTGNVRVMHSHFEATPAPYVKTDIDLLLKWYAKHKSLLHPFILASIFHHKFEKIHPFFDGNGRTGRMLMNAILLNAAHPPFIVRKKNRPMYLEVLSKADKADLTETPASVYKPLTNFLAREYTMTYWNSFL